MSDQVNSAPFQISEAAAAQIRLQISGSGCAEPIASLGDSADPGHIEGLLDAAIGGASEETLKDLLLDHFGRDNFEGAIDSLPFELFVGIYEAGKCNPDDLVDICAIRFAMPTHLRDALQGFCLEYEGRRFVLRGPNGTHRSLISATERRE